MSIALYTVLAAIGFSRSHRAAASARIDVIAADLQPGPNRARAMGTGPVNPCLLIPIYEHGSTIRRVVESLAPVGLALLIVNDGSGADTQATLDRIARDLDWVDIHCHTANRGKGAALVTGYHAAAARGFTHVIQLDADAQHEAADVCRFLAVAREKPDALVLGQPVLGADVPRSRLNGRKLWVSRAGTANHHLLPGFSPFPSMSTAVLPA